ncbi:MAG: hypothetical protein GX236_04685 [Clostridiaceae bacterium]|jgi:hypothetical protein|nr:hypothetical protein [Clostridiaceae bacterium]
MSQIRLVIADSDAIFLEKFSTYLQKKKASGFSLELFTDKNKLVEWFRNGDNADLIIISSSLFNELDEKPEKKNIFLLRDCAESLIPRGFNGMSKYMPADQIMKEILSLCSEYIPQDINDETGLGQINLVLYADGSDALNPLAQGIAYIKATKGKRTFFLNLDEFSNIDCYFHCDNTKGLSEMIYYVKSQKDNLSLKAEVCTSYDSETGLYFMKGHNNPEDVTNLNEEELSALIKSIQKSSPYEEIIISRAYLTDQLNMILLNEAQKIYISALNYPTSLHRLLKIGDQISLYEEKNGYRLKDKITFCINLINNVQESVNLDMSNSNFITLPYLDNRNTRGFLPSNEYLAALETAIESLQMSTAS